VTGLQSKWWMYVIETEQGALYTGVTTDVTRRFSEHCQVFERVPGAKGAKFFRCYKPKAVVYTLKCSSQSEACQRESAFKALTRVKKLQHIRQNSEV